MSYKFPTSTGRDHNGWQPSQGENPVVRERRFGSFTRRVRLADNLDAETIEASHHDGVLEIRIPVREEAKPRKIAVGTPGEAKELPAG